MLTKIKLFLKQFFCKHYEKTTVITPEKNCIISITTCDYCGKSVPSSTGNYDMIASQMMQMYQEQQGFKKENQ